MFDSVVRMARAASIGTVRPGIDPTLSARVRPTSDRRDQVLPLLPALAAVVPGGTLPRGALVAVEHGPSPADPAGDAGGPGAGGSTSLAFALLAAATAAGSWCAAVGVDDVGVLALSELGVDLERLVLVPRPGPRWAEVTACMADGMDAVLVHPPHAVRPGVARRLAARARERRCALVVLVRRARWPEGPDLRLSVTAGRWQGVGPGHGHLRGRQVELSVTGRRAASSEVRRSLWLPDDTGAVAPA